MKYDYLIVGCGITGATLAEQLARRGNKILIIDRRDHIGGNCYDYMDSDILVQKYGPHIFHTIDKEVWKYLSQFTTWVNYHHQVLSYYKGKYYPIPINRNTVNLFFHVKLQTEEEMRTYLTDDRLHLLYRAFIHHYTKKQWGKYPNELDSSILQRVASRHTINNDYFLDRYQGLPAQGYTHLLYKMLCSPKIVVRLNVLDMNVHVKYNQLIYTGPIDEYFNYRYGSLEYRHVYCALKKYNQAYKLCNTVINYPGSEKYSRKTEFKRFYNLVTSQTIIGTETFSNTKGIQAYPVLTPNNINLLKKYQALKTRTIFAGRLGTFQYLNMDQCVRQALDLARRLK